MKKRKIICFIFSAIALIAVIFTEFYAYEVYEYDKISCGTLYVNDSEITSENVILHHRLEHDSYSELPFTAVLEGLGYNVEWENDNKAYIIYNNYKYVLLLADNGYESILYTAGLTDAGNIRCNDNLIGLVCGGNAVYKSLEKELILSDNVLQVTLRDMGKIIKDKLDFDNNAVYITENTEQQSGS